MALLLALAAAAAAPIDKLHALERTVQEREAQRAAAYAPLLPWVAALQRLAWQPPLVTLARSGSVEAVVRTRFLMRGVAATTSARTADIERELIRLHGAQAQLAREVARAAENSALFGSAAGQALNRRLAALPPPAPSSVRRTGTAVYQLPATGRVLVGTGERVGETVSRGITLQTAPNARVVAPAAARVAYAGPFGGYGDIVILDHGHGWTSLLAGLALATAQPGERVGQGEELGRMRRDAPRLTVELRHDGRVVDIAGMALQRR
jgi:murein hydrolase activator